MKTRGEAYRSILSHTCGMKYCDIQTLYKEGAHALNNAGRRFIQGAHAVPSSVGLFRGPHLDTKSRVPWCRAMTRCVFYRILFSAI